MAMDLETRHDPVDASGARRATRMSRPAASRTRRTAPKRTGPTSTSRRRRSWCRSANGRRALVAGHKSGDRATPSIPTGRATRLWETRVGEGGSMGGVQWGSAADAQQRLRRAVGPRPHHAELHAVHRRRPRSAAAACSRCSLSDGARVWHTPPVRCDTRPRCSPAQSGAVSAMPGRRIRRLARRPHACVLPPRPAPSYGTTTPCARTRPSTASRPRGGSLDGPGPAIGGGMVFVNSGCYGGTAARRATWSCAFAPD